MLSAYSIWIMGSERMRSAGHTACKREIKKCTQFLLRNLKRKKLVLG
jgi:hypothetical protein